jgi:hypothetical protein
MHRWLATTVAFSLVLTGWAHPSHADIHALVIGINDYVHEQKLEGAVADAEDIAAALTRLGAKSITLLKNREASRHRVERAWKEVLERARPDDTIVVTYAGHGGQEPWKSDTGRRETAESFLLPEFISPRPKSGERILGKELKVWFRRAAETRNGRLRIVFVADACHSGGMMRSLDPRAGPTYRSVPPYPIPDVPIPILDAEEPSLKELDHVTFLAATQADRRIPEIVIGGRKRGALSFAFARALEGYADQRGTGRLTNAMLHGYITATVRQLSEAQQTPEVKFRGGGESDLLLAGIPSPAQQPDELDQLRLRLDNVDEAQRQAAMRNLAGVTVSGAGAADLIWDGKSRQVLSGLGEPVAHGVTLATLQPVIDKWRLLPFLKRLGALSPLRIALHPGDGRHPVGAHVKIVSEPIRHAYVTVFNLSGDGRIQFLFPSEPHDPTGGAWRPDKPYELQLVVRLPIGADHAVVIASASPLDQLHRHLIARPPTANLAGYLNEALSGVDYAIGIQGLYTEAGR